jgi:xanthine/CO dehydrogenase XdhC/CoxF family maturation factor
VKDIYDTLREWKKRRGSDRHSGSEFALATLIRVKGSSYRWLGARMLICWDGRRVGSLNACIHTTLECTNMPALLKQ